MVGLGNFETDIDPSTEGDVEEVQGVQVYVQKSGRLKRINS